MAAAEATQGRGRGGYICKRAHLYAGARVHEEAYDRRRALKRADTRVN